MNRQRKPSPYHPKGGWGENVSTEKLKVSPKSEEVLYPSMRGRFYPTHPRFPSVGGIDKDENEISTEHAKHHPNPDQNSGNVSSAANEWPDYPDQPRH